ncbi:Peptidoglycan O-acetyltransferase [Rubripirellula tenax]|uniref:Peptidoglycan O-acetyltransferase n=1 Tax=Rubripirellula tenax TaxID=2528015 RepID=A0A5C6F1U7_9BACT|nr:MBOAT family protein [Rubripirellula tenax]TWU54490.1 Peptidoglycan O-acetyltransferase [Rubripirellula tenax]
MLFNSYEFIFLLLPIAFLGNRLLAGRYNARVIWLLACSLFFYAWWNPIYLPLLLATVGFNYTVGKKLCVSRNKQLLVLGVAANLCLIGYFKYANFFVQSVTSLGGGEFTLGQIALPLAISFFTFQQIAYLVDCYSGVSTGYRPMEYALFVSFFPQLIAGPIVHHAEMMPQIRVPSRRIREDLSVGLTIFSIGLFKKAVLADGIAPYANSLFDNESAWHSVTFFHAWIGCLAYGLQIYFDFSGYSDMAIGAARIFGIKLPLNFFAPYRSETISDFWRRWHMTLSHFLRDYLYFPLGGNRKGTLNRYRNLMITMLLGGLWHGAGWTFVLWGLLHGGFLVVQHGWSHMTRGIIGWKGRPPYRMAACAVTFVAVHFAWVYFRAGSLDSANEVARGMVGMNGAAIPDAIFNRLGPLETPLGILGIGEDTASGSLFVAAITWITALLTIVWTMPTTQQFMIQHEPAWEYANVEHMQTLPSPGVGWQVPLTWKPTLGWSIVISLISVAGVLSLAELSEFLYFQF